MMELILKGDAPTIPDGYSRLSVGAAVAQGDMWADVEFESWEPARSWRRGKIVAQGDCYIRKI